MDVCKCIVPSRHGARRSVGPNSPGALLTPSLTGVSARKQYHRYVSSCRASFSIFEALPPKRCVRERREKRYLFQTFRIFKNSSKKSYRPFFVGQPSSRKSSREVGGRGDERWEALIPRVFSLQIGGRKLSKIVLSPV
ncbi:hypothetical protein TNCV_3975311 [Trichonephila clavipes]|nr:hypothetical protein TNCV_3975311 [Trichonephila clavipes]